RLRGLGPGELLLGRLGLTVVAEQVPRLVPVAVAQRAQVVDDRRVRLILDHLVAEDDQATEAGEAPDADDEREGGAQRDGEAAPLARSVGRRGDEGRLYPGPGWGRRGDLGHGRDGNDPPAERSLGVICTGSPGEDITSGS